VVLEIPAPFVGLKTDIKPEWIDFNGHFNAGYYFVVFDNAVTDRMRFIGLDEQHRAEHQVTTGCTASI
jgi:acyl-CoA thioester hydrolase